MADFRTAEERADEDFLRDEARATNSSSDREQPEAATESPIRRKKTHPKKSKISYILKFLLIFILAASAGLLIFMFRSGISVFYIQGESMEPTLQSGTSVVLKQEKELSHGQIAFLHIPKTWPNRFSENSLLVKRVIAVPGDTISFDGTAFTVNGEASYPLPEGYKCESAPNTFQKTLGKKDVVVFGDNAERSMDSRYVFCNGKVTNFTVDTRLLVDYGSVWMEF